MKGKEAKVKVKEEENLAEAAATRGRIFYGSVAKKFPNRIVVELQRTVRVPKYERFSKKKTRLHARIPEGKNVEAGDYVKVRECRPLSKIVHFMLVEVIRKAEGGKEK